MQDIHKGVVLISENFAYLPEFIEKLCLQFNFNKNYYYKLMYIFNGNFEQAIKEILYTAILNADSFESFRHSLMQAMQDYPAEYEHVLKHHNLLETFLPKYAIRDLL